MLTVGELIDMLEDFDRDMPVKIGMMQRYGTDFAYNICEEIEEHKIRAFYGDDYKAVVLKEGSQIGAVAWNDDEDDCEDDDEDWDEE